MSSVDGQGSAIVTSTRGCLLCRFLLSPRAREGDYQPHTETAEHRHAAGHHEDCAHDERLHSDTPSDVAGTRRQYVAALHQARLYHQACGHALRQSHVSDHQRGLRLCRLLAGRIFHSTGKPDKIHGDRYQGTPRRADAPAAGDGMRQAVRAELACAAEVWHPAREHSGRVHCDVYPFFGALPLSIYLSVPSLGAVFVLTVIVLLSFSLLRERRRKREALRNLLYEHETLCLAIEGNSTYAWRLEGDSVSCDSQFCELIHHRPGRLLLDEITPYIHPDDLPVFRKNIASRHERTHHKGQYRCNFTGEFQWWEFSYNTIHTPGHAPIIAGLLQNIQELKDHEQELIESRELAEQAELKQSFLNNMSHEIRTPLNAIVGFSDMLANEPEFSDEERQEFVDIINTNTKLLLKLVGDVLELSRIESGNLSFIFQRESVRQLLDDVYQTHSLLIQPPLQFLKDFPPEDVQVNVDPMRLTQVLTNFLNNANKFTKEGSIQLGYCCPSGMSEVHLYVEDTGIGIPHSEQKMIFERFYKRSEFSQGVGLGLSICVLIVEKMGGRIELQLRGRSWKPFHGGAALY